MLNIQNLDFNLILARCRKSPQVGCSDTYCTALLFIKMVPFLMLAHMCFLSLLLFTISTLLSNEWALHNNRAGICHQLFKCLDGPLLSCYESCILQLEVWTSATFFCNCNMVPFQVCIGTPAFYSRVSRSYTRDHLKKRFLLQSAHAY